MLSRPLGCLTVVALLSTPALAQNVTTSQGISITVRGIVNATFFAQDADFNLGSGQRAQVPTAERSRWVHGGDARNTRLSVAIAGPEVSRGWRGSATAELDFFGAFNGGGAFGDEQPQPRLRLAYADLSNGRTTLRIGQDWDLLLGNIPVSTSHLAFPLGHGGGGFVGWRFTQVRLMKMLGPAGGTTTKRVQLAMLSGSWIDDAGGDNGFSAGERGAPQFEARFDYGSAKWSGYLVAHTDTKATPGKDLASYMVELGANTTRGDLTLQANAWTGKGMAHHIAQIFQFGDIKGFGAWAQVGYTLNPKWSVWGFYGTDRPSDSDISNAATVVTDVTGVALAVAARRFSSWQAAPMIRYKSGPYSVGLEWLHSEAQIGPDAANKIRTGNEVAFSTRYDF
jgi:hypothetical protein